MGMGAKATMAAPTTAASSNPFAGLLSSLCCGVCKPAKEHKSMEQLEADVDAGYSTTPQKTRSFIPPTQPQGQAPTASGMLDPSAMRNAVAAANPGQVQAVLPATTGTLPPAAAAASQPPSVADATAAANVAPTGKVLPAAAPPAKTTKNPSESAEVSVYE